MADSTIADVTKMKVIDLRKELKSRGLASTGDKAELIARLQAAISQDSQDDHADINLDSDEIDSDGVLDEDEDKSQHDLLEDSAVESINEELALAENPAPQDVKPTEESKPPPKSLKRRITMNDSAKEKESDDKTGAAKESCAKKIVLNRSASITLSSTVSSQKSEETAVTNEGDKESLSDSSKVKAVANMDAKTRLELRAKRFGLPVKMSDAERKEARKQRFGQVSSSNSITSNVPAENFEKLKKRAERFGQSVSKLMTDIENKEKLERRKAKFGTTVQ